MDYSRYQHLHIRTIEPGILDIVMGREDGKLSTAGHRMRAELAEICPEVQEGIASHREKCKPVFPLPPSDF